MSPTRVRPPPLRPCQLHPHVRRRPSAPRTKASASRATSPRICTELEAPVATPPPSVKHSTAPTAHLRAPSRVNWRGTTRGEPNQPSRVPPPLEAWSSPRRPSPPFARAAPTSQRWPRAKKPIRERFESTEPASRVSLRASCVRRICGVRLTSAVHLQNAVQSTVRPTRAVPGVLAGATAC